MLILVGASHQSAPIEVRERMAVREEHLRAAFEALLGSEGVEEGWILSTCNRVELLVRAQSRRAGVTAIRSFLTNHQGFDNDELERYTFHLANDEAVHHLFRVASGLDSMILGEPQILGQVKQAYLRAKRHQATGPVLDRLLQYGLSAAKRVRTETGISRHPVSVAYAAAQLGCNIFGDLEGRRALLIGTGKMSSLVARHLMSHGVAEVIVAGRNYNNAVAMAERTGGRAVRWDDGLLQLAAVDIVVSCTDASQPILTKRDVRRAVRSRRGEPLFLIDIAVPRDIDPAVNDLDNAYLYDIDGLQNVVDAGRGERRRAAEQAHLLIDEEVRGFIRWRESQAITPMIVGLREALLEMGDREVERFRRKLGTLGSDQQDTVRQLTRAVIQKILHRPIRHLRSAVDRGDIAECLDLYRELFGVDPNSVRIDPGPAEADEPPETDEDALGPRRLLRGGKED